eukprot:362407-Chlamydomonas_euryale.AAC.2
MQEAERKKKCEFPEGAQRQDTQRVEAHKGAKHNVLSLALRYMESQGVPLAAAGPGDARCSKDHRGTSRLNSSSCSNSSPQDSATFRSDIYDESDGYVNVEGAGEDCSVRRETGLDRTGPSESIASDEGNDNEDAGTMVVRNNANDMKVIKSDSDEAAIVGERSPAGRCARSSR